MEHDSQKKKKTVDARILVNYDDPPRKSPPSLSVGPIGWMRENLFGSPFDAILTLISVVVIIAVTVGVVGWSVRDANWLTINQNFRNFMAGTYPAASTWRLNFLVYITGLVTGFSIGTYSRVGRDSLAIIGVLLAILFALPAVASAMLPDPSTFVAAGAVDVQSGTVTETPNSRTAFVAIEGVTVQVTMPAAFGNDDGMVAASGFTDRSAKAYYNAAANRRDDITRLTEVENRLAAHERSGGSLLACSQFIDAKKELVALRENLAPLALNEAAQVVEVEDETLLSCNDYMTFPETDYQPISSVYNVNTTDVTVRVLDRDGTALNEATLSAGEGAFSVQIPADGWYILETEATDEGVLVVLDTTHVYPIIERSVVENLLDEDGEPILNDRGRLETETVSEYINVYSRFITRDERPELGAGDDAEQVPILRLTDAQYNGERPFVDYITLGLAPTFDQLNMATLLFTFFGVIGYGAAVGIRRAAPKNSGTNIAGRIATGSWALYAYLTFLISIGVASMSGIGLGNLLGMLVWVGVMFFIGMNYPTLERNIGQGLLGLGLVMILGHIVYYRIALNAAADTPQPFLSFAEGVSGWAISVGFILQVILWVVVGLFSFNTGVASETSLNANTRRRGLIGVFVLWLAVLVGGPLLVGLLTGSGVMTNYRGQNLIPIVDMRLWGGFLLTFMLTTVGIVASFPIGILLALGRRAHRYPAIKYACILYIEFVRGVPLISVLFMASLLVPLVNPAVATVPQVVRAMVGIIMFSAAYLAENVRGGLQSIPGGQEEAGKALGLNNVQVTTEIMLPQALRAVIPALVGQAITLFKDTSLVYIIGLADLTGVAIRVVAQSEFVGYRLETLTYISVIYFIFSYVMSFVSRRIEASGSGSARR